MRGAIIDYPSTFHFVCCDFCSVRLIGSEAIWGVGGDIWMKVNWVFWNLYYFIAIIELRILNCPPLVSKYAWSMTPCPLALTLYAVPNPKCGLPPTLTLHRSSCLLQDKMPEGPIICNAAETHWILWIITRTPRISPCSEVVFVHLFKGFGLRWNISTSITMWVTYIIVILTI